VYHQEVELLGEFDDLLKESQLDGSGGRVVRVVHYQHLRLRVEVMADEGDVAERFVFVGYGVVYDACPGHGYTIHVYREVRVRHERGVAGSQQSEAHVRETFLGADGRDDFIFGVDWMAASRRRL